MILVLLLCIITPAFPIGILKIENNSLLYTCVFLVMRGSTAYPLNVNVEVSPLGAQDELGVKIMGMLRLLTRTGLVFGRFPTVFALSFWLK